MQRLDLNRNSSRQRGMSLPETLVALFIFSVVFMAALSLYQRATRAYQATDAATIQQQNARFAIDRMSETIRDAGANFNPRGKSDIADEQIEGAWQSAIVVRGDFDNSRETALQYEETAYPNGTFPIVTIGNDEVVAYVLRGGGTTPAPNNKSISIRLDLTPASGKTGRDAVKTGTWPLATEELKTIAVAATQLTEQTSPPYDLVRVSFDAAGNETSQVIAENVFRMAFKYANATGTNLITTSNDGGDDAQRADRESIRSIGIDLVMMSDRKDMQYKDGTNWTNLPKPGAVDAFPAAPAETSLTKNRRKYRLSEEIMSVNLGLKGYRHATVPGITIEPTPRVTACVGHHLSYYVKWDASPTSGVSYLVSAQSQSGTLYETEETTNGTFWEFKDPGSTERAFAFTVKAVSGGSESTATGPVTITADHDTAQSIPAPPLNVVGPTSGNSMVVDWDEVTTSVGTLNTSGQCISVGTNPGPSAPTAPWNTMAPDVKEYHVFRNGAWNANANFTPATGNRVDGVTLSTMVNTTPTTPTFTDNTAAPCAAYDYRVKTYDTENLFDASSSTAMSTSAHYMAAPGLFPTKPATPTPISVGYNGTTWTVQLQWTHVYTDNSGGGHTAMYRLERERQLNGVWSSDGGAVNQYDKTQMTTADTLPAVVGGYTASYRYRIVAVYPCATYSDTDRATASDWYYVVCTPPVNHSISITIPAAGEVVQVPGETGFVPSLGALPASGSQWTSATVKITGPNGGASQNTVVYGPYSDTSIPFNGFPAFNAVSLGLPDGFYTMTAYGTANGCDSQPITRDFEIDTVICGLAHTGTATLTPTTGTPSGRRKTLRFVVQNGCGQSIVIRELKLTWANGPNFSVARVNKVTYNGVDNTVSLSAATGSTIILTTPITIASGATSSNFDITYSHTMGDGSGGSVDTTWNSIIMRTGAVGSLSDDEVLVSPISPNN